MKDAHSDPSHRKFAGKSGSSSISRRLNGKAAATTSHFPNPRHAGAPLHRRPLLTATSLATTAVVLLIAGFFLVPTASSAAETAIAQCNGIQNVGGQAVECDVTVVNNLDLATDVASSTVTVEVCQGAANDPATLTCTGPTTTTYNQLTTSVDQCNGSGSGGGGTVTCNVTITNNITGSATTSPATIDQCNGSGGDGGTEPTVVCTPLGNTTDATITQCNDSGNGGGGPCACSAQSSRPLRHQHCLSPSTSATGPATAEAPRWNALCH